MSSATPGGAHHSIPPKPKLLKAEEEGLPRTKFVNDVTHSSALSLSASRAAIFNVLRITSALVGIVCNSEDAPSMQDASVKFSSIVNELNKPKTREQPIPVSRLIQVLNVVMQELDIFLAKVDEGSEDLVEGLLNDLDGSLDLIEELERHKLLAKKSSGEDIRFIMLQVRQLGQAIRAIMITPWTFASEEGIVNDSTTIADLNINSKDRRSALLAELPRATMASYLFSEVPGALEGDHTTTTILDWAWKENKNQMYWLTGGTEESRRAIALTTARLLAGKKNILSAAFFCSEDSTDKSNMELVFPTLAGLLAESSPQFCDILVEIIEDYPDIRTASLNDQVEWLIIEPSRKIASAKQPIVLIIDALDRCRGERAADEILMAIAEYLPSVPHLKIVVSSGPTPTVNFSDDSLFVARKTKGDIFPETSLFITNCVTSLTERAVIDGHINPPKSPFEKKSGPLFIMSSPTSGSSTSGDLVLQFASIASGTGSYFSHPPLHQLETTMNMLRCMINGLRYNICGIEPWQLNAEVENLADRKRLNVPAALEYATCHWADHLQQVLPTDPDVGPLIEVLTRFVNGYLLQWIELLSLLDDLGTALSSFLKVKLWLRAASIDEYRTLLEMLDHGYQMTSRFFDTIKSFSAGVYLTMLPLISFDTAYHASFRDKIGRLSVYHGREAAWGTCVCTIQASGPVYSIAYSPDGAEIVSADYDNVCLWDPQTGKFKTEMNDPRWTSRIRSVVYPRVGIVVIGSSYLAPIGIVSLSSDDDGNESDCSDGFLCPPNHVVVPNLFSHTAMIWETGDDASKSLATPISLKTRREIFVMASADGRHIASLVATQWNIFSVTIWETNAWEEMLCFNHHYSAGLFALSPNYFLSGDEVRCIKTGVSMFKLHGCDLTSATFAAFSSDERFIAVGAKHGTVGLFDVASGILLAPCYIFQSSAPISFLIFSPDSLYLAASSLDMVTIWQVGKLESEMELLGHSGNITSIAFSPDGHYLASSSLDGTINVWLLDYGPPSWPLEEAPIRANCVDLSSDGSLLACGSHTGVLSIFDSYDLTLIRSWTVGSSPLTGVSFSPNRKLLVTRSLDESIIVWDTLSGQTVVNLVYPSPQPRTQLWKSINISFSADNGRLASIVNDTIRIWDTNTWNTVATLGITGCSFHSITLSSDGTLVAYGCGDDLCLNEVDNNSICTVIQREVDPRHILFSDDSKYVHSSAGTFDLTTRTRVDTGAEPEKRLAAIHLENGWIIDSEGRKVSWLPESYRTGHWSYTSNHSIIVLSRPSGKLLVMGVENP